MISYLLKTFQNIINSKRLIIDLTKSDIQKTYVQSAFGFIWVILDPIIMLGLLFIIFSSGVRGGSKSPEEFIPNVFAGIITYYFFADALRQGSKSISSYRYLVAKVNFKIEVLPIVKILSSFLIHLVFLLLFVLILFFLKRYPTIYWFQIFYYILTQLVFLFSITTLLSAIEPFFKDINKIIPIITRLLFWFTPIFWNINRIPEKYHFIIQANPLYYIVEGYRKSLVNGRFMWDTPLYDTYFILLCLIIGLLGFKIQSRLRSHFAEQL